LGTWLRKRVAFNFPTGLIFLLIVNQIAYKAVRK